MPENVSFASWPAGVAAPIALGGALLGGDRGARHQRGLEAYRFNAGEKRVRDSQSAYRHDRARAHYDRALCLYRFDAARAHSSRPLCAYQYESFRI